MFFNNTNKLFFDSSYIKYYLQYLNSTNSTLDLFTDYFDFKLFLNLIIIFVLLLSFFIQYIVLKYYLIKSIYNGAMANKQRNI